MKGWKALMIRLSLDRNWPRKEILNYIIQSKRSIQILEFSSSVHSDVYICSWIQIPWDLFSPLFDRFGTWEWLHWSIFPLGSPWHPLSHSRSFPLPAAPRPRASCWDRTLAVAKKKLWMIKLFLVIPFVTFLGWWVQVSENVTPRKRCVTSNDRGTKGHELNHLAYVCHKVEAVCDWPCFQTHLATFAAWNWIMSQTKNG